MCFNPVHPYCPVNPDRTYAVEANSDDALPIRRGPLAFRPCQIIGTNAPLFRENRSLSEELSRQAAPYRSVPGIGPLTAATLVTELPEPGRCGVKALAALSSLAPWANDSGGRRGRRSIREYVAQCAGYYTWQPRLRRGTTGSCGISIKACVIGARPRKRR